MLWILLEHFTGYFCLDLLDMTFEAGSSSLLYFIYMKDEDTGDVEIDYELLYWRQIKYLINKIWK